MKTIHNYITEKLKITDEVINRKTLPIEDVTPKDKPESKMETFRKLILDYQFYFDELSFELKEIFGDKLPIFRNSISIKEIEAEVHKKNCVICVLDKDFSYGSQSFKRYTVDRIELLATLLGEGDVKLGNGIIDCIYEYLSNKILHESPVSERLSVSKAISDFEKLDNTKFNYVDKARMFSNGFQFIHDYYFERVEADGYDELGKDGKFNLTFVETSLFHSLKGKMHRPTLITVVKDGETFKDVYDRIIEFYKDRI